MPPADPPLPDPPPPDPVRAVAACDVEGTLTTAESWRAIGAWLLASDRAAGYRAFFARRLPAALAARAGWRDRRVFQNAWMRDLLRLFAGMPRPEFAEVAERVVETRLWPARRPEMVAELVERRRAGDALLLVSGLYQPILEAFAARLADATGGPVGAVGTPLALDGERLAGVPAGPINVGEAKAARLAEALSGARPAVAYGDTAADLPMLRWAAAAVAVHPDPALRRVATELGWRVLEG